MSGMITRNDNKEDRSINPRHIVLPLLPVVVFLLILLPLLPLSLRVLLGVCLLIGLIALRYEARSSLPGTVAERLVNPGGDSAVGRFQKGR
jgi:hypothetical protein